MISQVGIKPPTTLFGLGTSPLSSNNLRSSHIHPKWVSLEQSRVFFLLSIHCSGNSSQNLPFFTKINLPTYILRPVIILFLVFWSKWRLPNHVVVMCVKFLKRVLIGETCLCTVLLKWSNTKFMTYGNFERHPHKYVELMCNGVASLPMQISLGY